VTLVTCASDLRICFWGNLWAAYGQKEKRVKGKTGREMARFRDEMDHLFNRFFDFGFPTSRRLFGYGDWMPRVDVSEGRKNIIALSTID
jgi:hypothetical protein